ncbi:MAG: MBOAT family protein [Planctomycetes bacterium]|nr:MBOAT family protein [Planctomycetota bacterium]
MVFNSYTFAIFFAIVVGCYWLIPSWRGRKLLLLGSSYLFYAAWDPAFVLLLWLSTAVDWLAAGRIAGAEKPRTRRAWLGTSLAVNLGLLGYFKYGRFLVENLALLLGALGVDYRPATPDIALPIGISFYTFQTLSYTIDVHRGQLRPGRSLLDFALYVTFFPQLVAGPIVRAGEFLPQCRERKTFDRRRFAWGLVLLLVGLVEKNVLADGIFADPVDAVFAALPEAGRLDLLVGMFGFACQVFFDFAGYSTCAVGAALCLGFRLPDNFRRPLAALGFTDLWSRWHVTLSTWIRDYLYFPLGGSKKGSVRTYLNLLATMWVIGLWHGASWNCILWGGINGVYIAIERALIQARGGRAFRNRGLLGLAGAAVTFVLFSITLVVFRAGALTNTRLFFERLVAGGEAGDRDLLGRVPAFYVLAVAGATFLAHWLSREKSLEELLEAAPRWLGTAVIAFMVYLLVTHTSADSAFIYFQF